MEVHQIGWKTIKIFLSEINLLYLNHCNTKRFREQCTLECYVKKLWWKWKQTQIPTYWNNSEWMLS